MSAGKELPTDGADIPRVTQAVSSIDFEIVACANATSAGYTAEDWYYESTSGSTCASPRRIGALLGGGRHLRVVR